MLPLDFQVLGYTDNSFACLVGSCIDPEIKEKKTKCTRKKHDILFLVIHVSECVTRTHKNIIYNKPHVLYFLKARLIHVFQLFDVIY